MRAHVDWSTISLAVDVWLIRDLPGGAMQVAELGRDADGTLLAWLTWHDVEPNAAKRRPTLTLPRDAFEAIMAAGGDVLPPDRAQGRHLTDTINVRDRLLGLLERQAATSDHLTLRTP